MHSRQLLNPVFLYRNRGRIVPYLEDQLDHLRNRAKLARFRERHAGERCFVVGNGPSLTTDDLEKLSKEVTFACNKIYLAFPRTSWRPSYYVLEDDHVIRLHSSDIRARIKAPTFVNAQWKHLFDGQRDTMWYRWRLLDDTDFPRFSSDPLDVLYCRYMVTFICLQLAFFMGFSRVYLVGVDFSYSLTYKEGAPTTLHAAGAPEDHFVGGYFQPGEMRYLPRPDKAEIAMRCAKAAYESHGRTIFNATRGGKLDVFTRVNLDTVINAS
jgi:hypothetical protein